ncbi:MULTISPECIES: hypothetical protein [Ramlibacter]|uniref:Uncharacterized protein n=1 Tax=Ramlibacter aquaticus TaxID=2780094 RepID=A0ABR9SF72_9BURK|nr:MULTISPECIES: hypothetical protein [Ramlibacter]MBE7940968.1 hypothetical protein [Ramlibacter aquaticus]
MNKILIAAALLAAFGAASAKLPAPDDAAKAKAAEAAAKTAWQGKVDAYLLCKAQDRVAAAYHKSAGKGAAPAAKPAAAASKPAAGASGATGTPVASSAPPPCADPGPFAYNPPQQKPLETSEAHSPAGNATSPPSVRANSAQMAPAAPKK